MLTMASGETPAATRRISAADKLMAAPSGIFLPCLSGVPTEQRFSADDKEVVALVEILVISTSLYRTIGREAVETRRSTYC